MKQPKSRQIALRYSNEEWEKIIAAAERLGMTKSAYLKAPVAAALEKDEAMCRELTQTAIDAIKLRRQGMRPRDIADKLKTSQNRINCILHYAKARGNLDAETFDPKPRKRRFRDILAEAEINIGGIVEAFDTHVDDNIATWMIREAEDLGCKNLAEYFTELVLEEYHRQKSGTE